MACPLSAILNTVNLSPRLNRRSISFDASKEPVTPEAKQSIKSANYGFPSHITLSPRRGALYHRRLRCSPDRLDNNNSIDTNLLTPPPTNPRIPFQYSSAPPTPELNFNKFSVFNALLNYPEIVFELSKHLDVDALVNLYAVSKEYHRLINGRFTSVILSQSLRKAPESSRTFLFKCYRNLCMRDPAARPLHPAEEVGKEAVTKQYASKSASTDENSSTDETHSLVSESKTEQDEGSGSKTEHEEDNTEVEVEVEERKEENAEIRCVPSFRWLRMILFREQTVSSIVDSLAAEGLLLPLRASLVLKKLWFTMDIPDTTRRIALMRNHDFWGDDDIFVATLIFVKIDMRLTDPVEGDGETELRRMLFAQRSLSALAGALKRDEVKDWSECLSMWVRWKWYPHRRRYMPSETICGVPADECGTAGLEGWGKGPKLLVRVDELVMSEAVRRGMDLEDMYADMMLWGFVDKATGEDIWAQTDRRRESATLDLEEELGEGSGADENDGESEDIEEGWEEVDEEDEEGGMNQEDMVLEG